ncbi:MAG TPA: hypothetical protein VN901_23695 [Candidatus Acidoferrales bacterium]|nr:hypothetical protein [Candidatus Acidoferrales bacterium]
MKLEEVKKRTKEAVDFLVAAHSLYTSKGEQFMKTNINTSPG